MYSSNVCVVPWTEASRDEQLEGLRIVSREWQDTLSQVEDPLDLDTQPVDCLWVTHAVYEILEGRPWEEIESALSLILTGDL